MNLRPIVLAASAVVFGGALASCSDDAPSNGNPAKLWLALDGSEVQVRLVTGEPPPF
jgi:hypothetical protein